MKTYNLGFNVRNSKVAKTVNNSLKKAYFYKCANFDYNFTKFKTILKNNKLKIYNIENTDALFHFYYVDALIRHTDDILDDELARKSPLPINEMNLVINSFEKQLPIAKEVATLFRRELLLLSGNNKNIKKNIKDIIEVRPSDYFLIVDLAVKKFGSNLNKKELKLSDQYLRTNQTLRDLLDDILSIEEDTINKDYNSIVIGKKNFVEISFFEKIIKNKIRVLGKLSNNLNNHPNSNIFFEMVDFWNKQYEILFEPLLKSYYLSEKDYEKKFFIVK